MKRIFSRQALVLGALGLLAGGVAALNACSSSSAGGAPFGGQDAATMPEGDGGSTTSCTSMDALQILFSPMYSAYESSHQYQVPAVVNGMDNTGITWSASPSSAVTFATDPNTGGVIITMAAAPSSPVTITANASGQCGTSQLTITSATAAQWQAGHDRYNSNTPLYPACIFGGGGHMGGGDGGGGGHGGGPGFGVPEGGCPDAGPACTNCHGPSANAQFGFQDIAHTPEQTGGFSDQDMIGIFTQGVVPGCGTSGACEDGGYFDPTIINIPTGGNTTAYEIWHSFHQWTDIQGSDQEAMVIYLRSLTPTPQTGTSNFGGHYDGGGHHYDGGPHHHDGGGAVGEGGTPPPPADDASSAAD